MQKHTIQRLGRKYLSFSLCEGCGSSLLPCRALVYFQWYGFQASNHIIKALHHIYSSSKVSDNLQLFSTPTAKPWTNTNTLGSILIIWCILFLAWFLWEWTTRSHCILTVLIKRWIEVLFLLFHAIHTIKLCSVHDKARIFSTFNFSRQNLFHWKPHTQPAGNGFRRQWRRHH